MGKPYGKIPKKTGKRTPRKPGGEAFKIKFRGKDNAPLSMREIQQGLLETIGKLRAHDGMRAKWLTIYAVLIDEDGKEILPDPSGEWEIYPYKSAADEFGV